jgi:quercetin dioxygenase-like cupin family protein
MIGNAVQLHLPARGHDTMKTQPFVLTPEDYDPALDVLGTKVTVLASNAATQAYEITLQRGEEGTGPPLHSHDWDESFFVTRGRVEFSYAGTTKMCSAGTLVHIPAGTVHGFSYGPGGGEILELTIGRGASASRMFTAVSQEIPPGPPDVDKVVEVLRQNGVTVAH